MAVRVGTRDMGCKGLVDRVVEYRVMRLQWIDGEQDYKFTVD